MRNAKYYISAVLIAVICVFAVAAKSANQELISLFPIQHYDQTVSNWIKSTDADFDTPLINSDIQQKRMDIFYEHYFGELSPWNPEYVTKILQHAKPDDLKTNEHELLKYFDNTGKPADEIGYGENFRPHTKAWIESITNNVDLAQFDNGNYQINNRGIAVDNGQVRVIPTNDVYLLNHKIAGEGYPFDKLQVSALWAGTPVYILGETRDHSFMMVVTPDFIGWVNSSSIARVDNAFVAKWSAAAKSNLAAITHTKTGLVDAQGNFMLLAYVGSVFPGSAVSDGIQLMVAVSDADRHAVIKNTVVPAKDAVIMPIPATPHQFGNIMNTMIGRPYGWGNLYFYNDCSGELKSLFTPFGIYLPRHSSMQLTAGKIVDLNNATPEKRLAYLMENGKKFFTIIYVGGHIIMYVGNYPGQDANHTPMAMTYQNMWGLRPHQNTRRAVIGKSVLFPMLLQYPEDTSLKSQASKDYFQISYLNEEPAPILRVKEQESIDLKSLMFLDIPYLG